MSFGKEFVVKEIMRDSFEVWLVERVTGKLLEKYGVFNYEDEAEEYAERLQGWSETTGYNDL